MVSTMETPTGPALVHTLPLLPLLEAVSKHDPNSVAVVHCASGRTFRYGELLGDVARARDRLLEITAKSLGRDLNGERVAFLVENGYDYVVTLLSIIASRAIAVPLSPAFPTAELQYILGHSGASILCVSTKFAPKTQDVLKTANIDKPPRLLLLEKHMGECHSSSAPSSVQVNLEGEAGEAGMMLYTSGTTDRPKGVLLPAATLTAQCMSLVEAWEYTKNDHLLHVLPLHHIHGTVNALLAPLLAGSTIEFLFPFNPDKVWRRFAAPFLPLAPDVNASELEAARTARHTKWEKITFFTVVPTVYSRLLSTFKDFDAQPETQRAAREAISPRNLRLNISGSAALPTPLKQAWTEVSNGNVLLERYGMTEVGMALSCGLHMADRIDNSVGWPLPSVEARLVDLDSGEVVLQGKETAGPDGRERQGEIQLRGPTIFREYWNNPAATEKEFVSAEPSDPDQRSWFKTGDVAVRRRIADPDVGTGLSGSWTKSPYLYFIQGRRSADIIKSGGEKVSALEVERELLSLPQVAEAAVLAVPSGRWGHKVGCVLVLDPGVVQKGERWGPMDMRRALRDKLANYKIPQVMKVVNQIKRNAMGKINKKVLAKEVFQDDFSGDEF